MPSFRRSLPPPAGAPRAIVNGSSVRLDSLRPSALVAAGAAAASRCAARARRRRNRSHPAARRSSDRAHRRGHACEDLRTRPTPRALSIFWRSLAFRARSGKPAAPAAPAAASRSSFQIRFSISARCACAAPAEIYVRRHQSAEQLAVNARSEAREGYRAYRSTFDIASAIGVTCCRCVSSSPMKRCYVTAPCRSEHVRAAHRGAPAQCRRYSGDRSATGFLAGEQQLEAALIGGSAAAGDNAAGVPNVANVGSGLRPDACKRRPKNMLARRRLCEAAAVLAGASAVQRHTQAAAISEAPTTKTNTMQPPLAPVSSAQYRSSSRSMAATLPWRMTATGRISSRGRAGRARICARHEPACICWATTASRPAQPSNASKATRSASSSPTCFPAHQRALARHAHSGARMDGVGGLTQPAHRARQDLRLRICAQGAAP